MSEILEFVKSNVWWVVSFLMVIFLLLNDEAQKAASSLGISPRDLSHKINQGSLVYDIRKKVEFDSGHIRGSENISISKAKAIISNQMKKNDKQKNDCIFVGPADAVHELFKGMDNPSQFNLYCLDGGIAAWSKEGFQLEKTKETS